MSASVAFRTSSRYGYLPFILRLLVLLRQTWHRVYYILLEHIYFVTLLALN